MDAQELLKRYANGETTFINAKLNGVNLFDADLIGIDLDQANLSNAILTFTYLNQI